MRLRPHGTDSGALSRSRNRLVNPLDAPPHPQKSFYLTPRSTPMQYQVIILAFRYLLASFGRGAAARPRWFRTELVQAFYTTRAAMPLHPTDRGCLLPILCSERCRRRDIYIGRARGSILRAHQRSREIDRRPLRLLLLRGASRRRENLSPPREHHIPRR